MDRLIDYYEILHVSQNAPIEVIKLAYKGLAQKYHPDRYKGSDANEKMQLINEALDILTNFNKRAEFDSVLNAYRQKEQAAHDNSEYQKRNQNEYSNHQYQKYDSSKQYSDENTHKNDLASKNINVQINIKIPKVENLLKPFINIYQWLIQHKRIIRLSIIALFVGAVIISIIAQTIKNKTYSHDTSTANTTDKVVDNTTNSAYQPASFQNPTSTQTNNDNYIENDHQLMVEAVDKFLSIIKAHGILGAVSFINNCYANQNYNQLFCIYFDDTARIANSLVADKSKDQSIDFFSTDNVAKRVDAYFYTPYNFSSELTWRIQLASATV